MYRILSQLTLVLQNTALGKLKQVTEWQKAFAPVEPVAADPLSPLRRDGLGLGGGMARRKTMGDFSLRNYFPHSSSQGQGCLWSSLCIVVPASRFQTILHPG